MFDLRKHPTLRTQSCMFYTFSDTLKGKYKNVRVNLNHANTLHIGKNKQE